MKRIRRLIAEHRVDALALAGAGSIVAGLAMIYVPAALIAAGGKVLWVAWRLAQVEREIRAFAEIAKR